MIEGITPETCRVEAVALERGPSGVKIGEYTMDWSDRIDGYMLVEYGCDRGERYEIRRRHIDNEGDAMDVESLRAIIGQVNYVLRQNSRCTCVHRDDEWS